MRALLRRSLYACLFVLAATGVAYAIPRYADLYFGREWPAVASPALMMKLHGAFSFWALLLLGGIWQVHVRVRIRRPANRGAGLVLIGAMTFLTVSGYLLYYLGSREAREFSSVAHTVCGLAVVAILAWHIRYGWRAARRRVSERNLSALLRGRAP